jgi:hypothetical protein
MVRARYRGRVNEAADASPSERDFNRLATEMNRVSGAAIGLRWSEFSGCFQLLSLNVSWYNDHGWSQQKAGNCFGGARRIQLYFGSG